jgi:hypothetical protein
VGKYGPLHAYLRRRRGAEVRLTFTEVERIIGGLLPKAARKADWWANAPSSERRFVQCAAWLEAGFQARSDLLHEAVRFSPSEAPSATPVPIGGNEPTGKPVPPA